MLDGASGDSLQRRVGDNGNSESIAWDVRAYWIPQQRISWEKKDRRRELAEEDVGRGRKAELNLLRAAKRSVNRIQVHE